MNPRTRSRRVVAQRVAVVAIALGLVVALAEAAHVRRLSRKIAPMFESELWSYPTQIYSRPLVLRPGERIGVDAVVQRLQRLGYTESADAPDQAGQYRVRSGGLEIYTREFALPDRALSARSARIAFSPGGRVVAVRELASGAPLEALTLEPEVLATLHGDGAEQRTVLRLDQFPDVLVQAVIAAEDQRFFEHPGVDPLRIVQAMWVNMRQGRVVQGASTITQQTVRNLFLGPEKTWSRKLREANLALALELRYPKERVLEVYLNEIYLGQHDGVAVCGFGQAARRYFGKSATDLDLAESALLAAMIPSPSVLNPLRHRERAIAKRDRLLQAMREQGRIGERDYRAAVAEVPRLASAASSFRGAPCFAQFVRAQLRTLKPDDAEITGGGLRVFTTLDTRLQQLAEGALRGGLARLEREQPRLRRRGQPLEAAMIVLRPDTGEILAEVGGRDFQRNQFDRALLARRQTGSLFKPFVYLAGFERAAEDPTFFFTPATPLDDSPFVLESAGQVWNPQNYDGEYRGVVSVRQALEESLNVPTVRASQLVGIDRIAALAERSGLGIHGHVYPSIALGAEQVSLLEMAQAYAAIANEGVAVAPRSILAVADRDGEMVKVPATVPARVASPGAAYLTLDLMRGVIERGTAQRVRAAGLQGDFAGKTGTTNDKRDSWFIGFGPDLLAAVWVGFDDDAETGLTGASGALPIWIDFMKAAGYVPRAFEQPREVVRLPIDPHTGGLATTACPEVVDEVFVAGTEPDQPCPEHDRGGMADGDL
ncbi:MAG TPA: PBP1A family penicillin-binding protein [Candidatus Polarisedimenticolaceae bacterium]|nr:PBP1A family penicillin-binding protein [Candidatus Polarisedimenticolaceae bacterium]